MNQALIIKPRLSEQTYAMSQQKGIYVFDVPLFANRHEVARAVAKQFEVEVLSVNIAKIKGKRKSTISITGRRRRAVEGSRSDVKKAYVRLVEGNSLPVFAAVEASEEKEQAAQEQANKLIAKQAKQDTKQAARGKSSSRPSLRMFKKQGDK